MTNLKIIEMKTAELVPYLNNPRKNDKAVDPVAKSIKEFGFKVPIIVDKEKVIVAGHTRLRAAKKLGLETVPVVIADDLTENQIKAFRLADNKTAEFSEWDQDLLIHELLELQTADFEMLREDAVCNYDDRTAVNYLGRWFEENSQGLFWDGEGYNCDEGERLYPVMVPVRDDEGAFEIVGYTFSSDHKDHFPYCTR